MTAALWRRIGIRRTGMLLLIAILGGLAACSGSKTPPPQSSKTSVTPDQSSPTEKDLSQAATAAVAIANAYVPSGYRTPPVSSGYDWSAHTGQEITESLPNQHLFQVACSGNGKIAVRFANGTHKEVACGEKAITVQFSGKFDATVDGAASNDGVYAWRILAKE